MKTEIELNETIAAGAPRAPAAEGCDTPETVSTLPPGYHNAGDIVNMELPSSELIFENELLAHDSMLTILGQGGIGKSRLVLQMLVAIILGRLFLGFRIISNRLKILVLQDQNSNRRLKADLIPLKNSMSVEEWAIVNDNLVLRTTEDGVDQNLDLSDPDTLKQQIEVVKQVQPDIIVFDPLESCTVKGLENSATMKKVLDQIRRLARSGKPKCATIIVHHAQAGKSGMVKVSGYDRTGFGRGSRALHSITRGQINVAPANADENTVLIVACGKNSNGPEFKPFAIRLNPTSKLYEVDTTFDMKAWLAKMTGEKSQDEQLTPEGIAEIVRAKPMKKADLVKAIADKTGYGKSRVYTMIDEAVGQTIRCEKKMYKIIKGD